MAEGLSESTANALLAAIFQSVSYASAGLWVQLHIGAPGPSGSLNVAVNSTRVDASGCFGTTPASGDIANDAQIGPWVSVPATETYTHASLWTDPTVGTFTASGVITSATVAAGDDFPIPIGDLTASFPIAS